MSLRERFFRLLDRGAAPDLDPESPVEVADVRIYEGPMLLSVLEAAGIEAHGVEATGATVEYTSRTRMRIFVRRRDLGAAAAAIEANRQRPGEAP